MSNSTPMPTKLGNNKSQTSLTGPGGPGTALNPLYTYLTSSMIPSYPHFKDEELEGQLGSFSK